MENKNFWSNEDFKELSPMEKLVLLYLEYNNGAEINIIAECTGLGERNISLILASLELKGLIKENEIIQ